MDYCKKTAVIIGENNRKGIITLETAQSSNTLSVTCYNISPNDAMTVYFDDGSKIAFTDLSRQIVKQVKQSGEFYAEIENGATVGCGKTQRYKGEIKLNKNKKDDLIDEEIIEEKKLPEVGKEEIVNGDTSDVGFEGEVATVNYYENAVPTKLASDASKIVEFAENAKNGEKQSSVFYNEIKPQLDEIFSKYPPDEYLNSIIPSSKWAKITYDEEGKSYSVGVLTDGEDVLFIGYGVFANYSEEPPSELREIAQWVPKDFAEPKGEGYWMIYQKASDGENV